MTNPTRQEIIDAHEALKYLVKNLYGISLEEDKDTLSYNRLIKFLPPIPRLTMADVEWDDKLHYLAEAEHDVYGQVIMLGLDAGGLIEFIIPSRSDFRCDTDNPGNLTPTGRRYTLTETTND